MMIYELRLAKLCARTSLPLVTTVAILTASFSQEAISGQSENCVFANYSIKTSNNIVATKTSESKMSSVLTAKIVCQKPVKKIAISMECHSMKETSDFDTINEQTRWMVWLQISEPTESCKWYVLGSYN